MRSLTICSTLSSTALSDLDRLSGSVTLEPGQTLFDEGEPADHVFNVTGGCLKLYKLLQDGRRQVTGFLFSGDFLGLASRTNYAYSAEALDKATLCRFQRNQLNLFLGRHPELEHELLDRASHELAEAQEQMLLLGRKSARERLASFLLLLSRRAAMRGAAEEPVLLPMGRNDIADYLGLTTETVSRTFTRLRKDGLVRLLSGGAVALCDRKSLTKVAESS